MFQRAFQMRVSVCPGLCRWRESSKPASARREAGGRPAKLGWGSSARTEEEGEVSGLAAGSWQEGERDVGAAIRAGGCGSRAEPAFQASGTKGLDGEVAEVVTVGAGRLL